MLDSKKLMKKIFLFILNTLLILCNALCLYGYSIAVFKRNFEMVMISLPILPVFLIIGVIFYFLKNYLHIDKLNRKLPILAIVVYLITTFIDEGIQVFIKEAGIINYVSSPAYPSMIIILSLGTILFITTIICTFKTLFKN